MLSIDELRVSRKTRKCDECQDVIQVGEKYSHSFLVDKEAYSVDLCCTCRKLEDFLFANKEFRDEGRIIGELYDTLVETGLLKDYFAGTKYADLDLKELSAEMIKELIVLNDTELPGKSRNLRI